MECNTVYHGFYVKGKEYVEELHGHVYELNHEKSGAKALVVDNMDENKVFCVGFKTIPEDSTGVFHIIEHSVLNGSRKYPVKETFVELMKRSMKNYLNAMTYPDKTLYPFATINEKDYLNLMDVYLDAVFYPSIYDKKEVFDQEGWHYEFSKEEKKPYVNGVVYNEMKGAFSSVDSRLSYAVNKAMFPENAYGYVSGGDPEEIPNLTYEKFLAAHRKFYSSDNCYIVLYGHMDIEEKLEFINREYLSSMSIKKIDYSLPVQTAPNKKEHVSCYPAEQLTGHDVQSALAYHIGDIHEREKIMGTCILAGALMGNNEAPLKKALLQAGLGADISAFIMDGILQPYLVITLKNADEQGRKKLVHTVRSTVEALCRDGINKELLKAEINVNEFMMNEKGSSMPDGIICGINAISGWVHGQNPLLLIKYKQQFLKLRENLQGNYFEELLEELILNNPYQTQVSLLPESERQLKNKQLNQVNENLQLLNPLTIADLQKEKQHTSIEKAGLNQVTMLYYPIQTNGISYINWYFDLGHIEADDVSYIQLLSSLLGNLNTSKHNANQMNILLSAWIGNWNTYLDSFINVKDKNQVKAKFVMSVSVLNSNLSYAVSLPEELLLDTLFTQKDEIMKLVRQIKMNMEREFVVRGNYYASVRVSSYYTAAGMYQERCHGYSYYKFICGLLEDYENQFITLSEKLFVLQKKIFTCQPLTISFSGKKESYTKYKEILAKTESAKSSRLIHENNYKDNYRLQSREAFIIPSKVSYNVLGYSDEHTGANRVLAHILSYDYLWKKIRIHGGAYGAGMQLSTSGQISLYSYRDPSVAETYEVYRQIPKYLSTLKINEDEMTQYIIGTMGQYDAVLKARAIAYRLDRQYFSAETEAMCNQMREAICMVASDHIQAQSENMKEILDADCYCTFGNKEAIEKTADLFTSIQTV